MEPNRHLFFISLGLHWGWYESMGKNHFFWVCRFAIRINNTYANVDDELKPIQAIDGKYFTI
jgi:hypothetical protein